MTATKLTDQIIDALTPGANVLVNEQGVSKLADFGCSKQIPQLLTTSLEESLRSIRGSIPWMAPEVVKQERHGYKADIWSIGATVIEMATAKHPWPDSSNGLAAMYAIATATAPPPLPLHLSGEALSFLRRCFCINPDGACAELWACVCWACSSRACASGGWRMSRACDGRRAAAPPVPGRAVDEHLGSPKLRGLSLVDEWWCRGSV